MSSPAPTPLTVRRRVAGAVLVGTTVLALTACGSGDTSSPTTGAAAPTTGGTATVTVTPSSPAPAPTTVPSPGGDGGTGGTGGSSGGTDAGHCRTAELSAAVSGQNAGAGSVYLTLSLRNTGDRTCGVTGYPGVSLVGDGNGTQIGAPADRDTAGDVTTVRLDPGASAVAQLQVGNPENYGDRCTVVPADGLRIYPPDETAAVYVPTQGLRGCLESAPVTLHVRPLTPA